MHNTFMNDSAGYNILDCFIRRIRISPTSLSHDVVSKQDDTTLRSIYCNSISTRTTTIHHINTVSKKWKSLQRRSHCVINTLNGCISNRLCGRKSLLRLSLLRLSLLRLSLCLVCCTLCFRECTCLSLSFSDSLSFSFKSLQSRVTTLRKGVPLCHIDRAGHVILSNVTHIIELLSISISI